MKKCLFSLLAFVYLAIPTMAQSANDEIGRYSDLQFNHDKDAIFVNNTFIKSTIGIDVDTTGYRKYNVISASKQHCNPPMIINGVTYNRKITLHCNNEPEFVTLEDIRTQYCPNVQGTVIYMINKFFITNDVESYRIDKDFIQKCEILPSSEFEQFKDMQPFTFIRIFTKTKANTYPMRLGR